MTDWNSSLLGEIYPLGDQAAVVRLGDEISDRVYGKVQQLAALLGRKPFDGMIEIVAAYTTVTVYYDSRAVLESALKAEWQDRVEDRGRKEAGNKSKDEEERLFPFQVVSEYLRSLLLELEKSGQTCTDDPDINKKLRVVRIPVCYGGEFGPDLDEVARCHGLTADEVIRLHTCHEYKVYMLGFAPGFAYLGGLPDRLHTPRLRVPRTQIPAGSVGIGGEQTGVYPLSTPGGWNLIGRTPIDLFRPWETSPTVLQAGDLVRFDSISAREFERWPKGGEG